MDEWTQNLSTRKHLLSLILKNLSFVFITYCSYRRNHSIRMREHQIFSFTLHFIILKIKVKSISYPKSYYDANKLYNKSTFFFVKIMKTNKDCNMTWLVPSQVLRHKQFNAFEKVGAIIFHRLLCLKKYWSLFYFKNYIEWVIVV